MSAGGEIIEGLVKVVFRQGAKRIGKMVTGAIGKKLSKDEAKEALEKIAEQKLAKATRKAKEKVKKFEPERPRSTGETSSTKMGKRVHKQKADSRRASGEYDMVNEPFRDKNGNIIEVPKRVNKYGRPSQKTQRAIPDAVQGPPKGIIIDDKPLGRPISKDKQEMRRFVEAYEQKYGKPPQKIIIERYDPKTGAPVGKETYYPNEF